MFFVSRGLLRLTATFSTISFVLMSLLAWPLAAVVLLILGLAFAAPLKRRYLTTLGSAKWADERDLDEAGMLNATTGLILGRIETRPRLSAALWSLFFLKVSSQEACEQFLDLFRRDRARVVRVAQAIHTTVFAPSGGGKGVSCIVPFLLDCDESCVVIDFKGELAQLTAEHRRRELGHRVVLLDPYHVVTKTPDCFNPLDGIDENNPLAIDECNDLAKALVVRDPGEKERHWNDSAEAWIAAILAVVVRYGVRNGSRSLQAMRDFLSSPKLIELAIKLMCESDAWGGMLARMGGQLGHFVDREKSSTLSTVSRHLRFLDTPTIAASTQQSSFDPGLLRKGKMTCYLILPPQHMRAQSSLLRMWIGSLLKAVVRGGLTNTNRVHFVLDEAASLGHLEVIEDAVDKFRGYGVRMQFYYQSPGQLKKCFPEGQDQTLLSNTTQIYFGVNDTATAELVSSRLGEHTIIVNSGGTSDGTSCQNSLGSPQSSSSSVNSSRNWQQQARKLLKPEEVIALPPRVAITFTPGVPPVCTTLLRYYEEPTLGHRTGSSADAFKVGRVLVESLVLFICSATFAVLLLTAVYRASGI